MRILALILAMLFQAYPKSNETAPAIVVAPVAAGSSTMVALTQHYRYSFLAPRGWGMVLNEAMKSLRINAPAEQGAYISIEFADEGGKATASADLETWSSGLRKRYPGAVEREAFNLELLSSTAGLSDLTWVHADSVPMQGRFALVPVGKGFLELSLITPAKYLEACLPSFMQLIGSLRSASKETALEVRVLGRE